MRSRRDDLIETALKLFYTGGFNATGIDKILAESGVAKMTLYKHFGSKDELILAVLKRRDEQFRGWLSGEMAKAGPSPKAQLLQMFDALEIWFSGKAFPVAPSSTQRGSFQIPRIQPIRSRPSTKRCWFASSPSSAPKPAQLILQALPKKSPC